MAHYKTYKIINNIFFFLFIESFFLFDFFHFELLNFFYDFLFQVLLIVHHAVLRVYLIVVKPVSCNLAEIVRLVNESAHIQYKCLQKLKQVFRGVLLRRESFVLKEAGFDEFQSLRQKLYFFLKKILNHLDRDARGFQVAFYALFESLMDFVFLPENFLDIFRVLLDLYQLSFLLSELMNSLKDFGQNVLQLQIVLFVDLVLYHFLLLQKGVEFLLCVFNILLNSVELLFLVFLQILNELFSIGIHRA